MDKIVVGISGASGVILALRTIKALQQAGYFVDLVMTREAQYTASLELGPEFANPKAFATHLSENVKIHAVNDVGASICSGSYKTKGMVIIPCSMATVAAISCGLGDNCLRRAADVTLKEKRPLVVVFREAPLHTIHLENLLKLAQVGATILPPLPAWYNQPKSLEDVENFIVGKVLDSLQIEHNLYVPWGN